MATYCYRCKICNKRKEVVRPMSQAKKPVKCQTCNVGMCRDLRAEGVYASGRDYNRTIHSDSLAIAPSQRAEHRRLFPDVKLDSQNRPIFKNFRQHDDYLKKTGFVKNRQRKRRKATRVL